MQGDTRTVETELISVMAQLLSFLTTFAAYIASRNSGRSVRDAAGIENRDFFGAKLVSVSKHIRIVHSSLHTIKR